MELDTRIISYIKDHGPSSLEKMRENLRLGGSDFCVEKAIVRLMTGNLIGYTSAENKYFLREDSKKERQYTK